MARKDVTRASKRKGFLEEQRVRGTAAARDQQQWECTKATGTPPDAKDKEKRPNTANPNRFYDRAIKDMQADMDPKARTAFDQKAYGKRRKSVDE